jgi:hypothetical protein
MFLSKKFPKFRRKEFECAKYSGIIISGFIYVVFDVLWQVLGKKEKVKKKDLKTLNLYS